MPRPKVPAGQRQRVAEACNLCRETKKRCTGSPPCAQCLRRGLPHQCYITYAPRGSRARARAQLASSNAVAGNDNNNNDANASANTNSNPWSPDRAFTVSSRQEDIPDRNAQDSIRVEEEESASVQLLSPSDSRLEDEGRNSTSSTTNASRMLLNLRGERVYIGRAASISFLQIVRGLVAEEIGPSPFSHNEKSESMLETESPKALRSEPEPVTPEKEFGVQDRLRCMRSFLSVTEGFIHVFDPVELENSITEYDDTQDEDATKKQRPLYKAAVELVIAIGAQAESAEMARTVGQAYYSKARSRSFAGSLEDPDLDMARNFVLMAFYMLGECRRNSAFMYLGIAVQAALALGLHSKDSFSKNLNTTEKLRLQVWASIRIMDQLVNSILGRPSATARMSSNSENLLPSISNSSGSSVQWLLATSDIVTIITEITDKLYDQKEVATFIVEQLLQKIENWKRNLPQSMGAFESRVSTQTSPGSSSPNVPGGEIARVHISCLYYFAVTLVTRPFLMSSLTSRPLTGKMMTSDLATACLDAATYLSQTCAEALHNGVLQGNMCIMKALVFAAGLVLGFEIFAKRSAEHDIESAFNNAKEVLKHLSIQSPQAAHYLEILSSLSNAIEKRRTKETSTGKSRYVSKLFSLDTVSAGSKESNMPDDFTWLQTDGSNSQMGGTDTEWLFGEGEVGEFSLDWDSLNISLWDSFPHV